MAAIKLAKLSKIYPNGFNAVRSVDLEVADGEFMVLVGPSGCGKTTLLRMVAGLEDISDGVLMIGDREANMLTPKQRDIAMVFQNYALYPHMTVADNIGFALKLRKLPKQEINRRVNEAAQILGLTDWLDRKPGLLSGGQRQRVAMGRAIVREPQVFLMDEPLSNLDAKLRVQMRAEVTRIQRRLGVATLYVTHDQVEAMTMGDRVTVMRDGEVQQCSRPQILYDAPRNMFVASFIGSPSMNLYDATLDAEASSVSLGSQTLKLPDTVRAIRPGLQRYRNRHIVVGLRPEDLPVVSSGDDDLPVLEGDVDLVEALGSELLVHFSIDADRVVGDGSPSDDDHLVLRGEGVARVDPRAAITPGSRARFTVQINRIHFFDPATGDSVGT